MSARHGAVLSGYPSCVTVCMFKSPRQAAPLSQGHAESGDEGVTRSHSITTSLRDPGRVHTHVRGEETRAALPAGDCNETDRKLAQQPSDRVVTSAEKADPALLGFIHLYDVCALESFQNGVFAIERRPQIQVQDAQRR